MNDFGLSNEIREHARYTVGGSLRWLSPELLFDDTYDEDGPVYPRPTLSVASDVWSFGCTVYEVCASIRAVEELV